MKNVGIFLIRVCAMQTFAETKFLAERSGIRFGGQESIGAAFDDKLSIVKGDAVSGDLATPTRISFEQGDVYGQSLLFEFFAA